MEENKGNGSSSGWGVLILVFVGTLLAVFLMLWIGIGVRALGHTKGEAAGSGGADLIAYLSSEGVVSFSEGGSSYPSYQAVVLGNLGCVRVWEDRGLHCLEVDDSTAGVIYMDSNNDWLSRSSLGRLVNTGLVVSKQVAVTNEGGKTVFVSADSKLSGRSLLGELKYGDVVRVIEDPSTGEIIAVVLVFRGALL